MSLKIENLVELLDFLSATEPKPVEKVAERFRISRRTVIRYINEIETAFDPPIIARSHEGYRLVRNDFLEILEQQGDCSAVTAVATAGPSGKEGGAAQPRLFASVSGMIEARSTLPEPILDLLLKAMGPGRYLDIDYRAKDVVKRHRIVPIKMFIESGLAYFVAWDEGCGFLLCLGGDKIEHATRTDGILDADLLLDLRSYVNGAWGMMIRHQEKLTTDVTFEANSSVIRYFVNHPLHASQLIEERHLKHYVTIRVHNPKEIVRFLLRFGMAVKITGPEEALEEVASFLSTMQEFYARDNLTDPGRKAIIPPVPNTESKDDRP